MKFIERKSFITSTLSEFSLPTVAPSDGKLEIGF
jgi:hypothetical protein